MFASHARTHAQCCAVITFLVLFVHDCPQDLPCWNYDGSSTGQAPGEDSEVYLVPRAIYKDPFRMGDNILVMCDTYEPPRVNKDGTLTPIKPLPSNTRNACAEVMEKAKAQEPWFGIEQVRPRLLKCCSLPVVPHASFPVLAISC